VSARRGLPPAWAHAVRKASGSRPFRSAVAVTVHTAAARCTGPFGLGSVVVLPADHRGAQRPFGRVVVQREVREVTVAGRPSHSLSRVASTLRAATRHGSAGLSGRPHQGGRRAPGVGRTRLGETAESWRSSGPSRNAASMKPSGTPSISPCENGHSSMVSMRPGSVSGRSRNASRRDDPVSRNLPGGDRSPPRP
jgi:hypothetical protein